MYGEGLRTCTPTRSRESHGFQDRSGTLVRLILRMYMAGVLGLEPRVPVLETGGLPLTDTPIFGE